MSSRTATIRPTSQRNLPVVDDLVHIERCHDGRGNGHLLDTKAVGVLDVLFSDLRCVVEVFLLLHGSFTGASDSFDAIQPLDGSGADVSEDDDTERESVNLGQWLAIHFPCEHDFFELYLSPWNRHDVVVDLAALEVGVCAVEFEMMVAFSSIIFFQPTTVFDDVFEVDTAPACVTDGTLTPWGIEKLVSVTRVLSDLLEAASACALKGDDVGAVLKEFWVLEVSHGELHGVVHETIEFEIEGGLIDFGDAAVVADEEVCIWSHFSLNEAGLQTTRSVSNFLVIGMRRATLPVAALHCTETAKHEAYLPTSPS